MKGKIFFLFFLAAVGVVTYIGYGVFQDRYMSEDTEDSQSSLFEKFKKTFEENSGNDTDEFDEDNANSGYNDGKINKLDADGNPIISKATCQSDCAGYKDSKDDFKYCKQLCGFLGSKETENEDSEECQNLSESSKDICLSNLAITREDFDICSEIGDKSIKDACNNTIIDKLYDESEDN